MLHKLMVIVVLQVLFWIPMSAQDIAHKHQSDNQSPIFMIGQHYGQITMVPGFHFETLFNDTALQVFAYDSLFHPLSLEGVEGEATLQPGEGNLFGRRLVYVPGNTEEGMDYLMLPYAFAATDSGVHIDLTLTKLPGKAERHVRFGLQFNGLTGKASTKR